jgi:hypothetical protein
MSEEETSLTRASGGSKSLRTTVPIFIAKLLKLRTGDKLHWKASIEKDGQVRVTVAPVRKQ